MFSLLVLLKRHAVKIELLQRMASTAMKWVISHIATHDLLTLLTLITFFLPLGDEGNAIKMGKSYCYTKYRNS